MQSIMDIEKMEQCIKKLEMYTHNESINVTNIANKYKEISTYYNSNNQSKLEDITFELSEKLLTIKKNHDLDINKLNKYLTSYIETATQNAKIFDRINNE